MKGSTLIILALVCAGLAWVSLKDEKKEFGSNLVANDQPLKGLDVNQTSKITLKKGKEELVLDKASGSWRASNKELDYPVNFEKLRDTLVAVGDLKLIEKKSGQEKYYDKFGLDEKSEPLVVQLFSGDKLQATLRLGKQRRGQSAAGEGGMPFSMPRDEGHYLTLAEKGDVFLSKERVDVEVTPTFWMKSSLAKVEKKDIAKVEFSFPHKSYTLDRSMVEIPKSTDGSVPPEKKTVWKASGELPEGFSFKENEIETLLDNMAEISVSQPVAKAKKKELAKTSPYKLKVSREDKTVLYELNVDELKETWYVCLATQPDELYQIDNYKVEQLFAASKSLFGLENYVISREPVAAITWEGGLDMELKRENDTWLAFGSAPLPEINKDKMKEITDLLTDLDLTDYHLRDVKPEPGPSVVFTLKDGKKIKVTSAGNLFLQDSNLITVEGLKGTYSVAEYTFNKLFPKLSDIMKIAAEPAAFEDVTGLTIGDLKLEKKDESWTPVGRSEKVKPDVLSNWFDSYKTIYASPFALTAKSFEPKSSLTVQSKDGKSVIWSFSDGDKGKALASSSQFGGTFTLDWELVLAVCKPAEYFLEPKPVEEKPKVETDPNIKVGPLSVSGGNVTAEQPKAE